MKPVIYRELKESDLTVSLFSGFSRRQIVQDCVRKENGKWIVKSCPFIDDWSTEDYAFLVLCLKRTIQNGGFCMAAFINEQLKGFVSVENQRFGSHHQYMELSSLHVSAEIRKKGIGEHLFHKAILFAARKGASKLYISAHSAIETQRFYQKMGCVEAIEICSARLEAEPFDCQLEYCIK